jgi:hypothetical protein
MCFDALHDCMRLVRQKMSTMPVISCRIETMFNSACTHPCVCCPSMRGYMQTHDHKVHTASVQRTVSQPTKPSLLSLGFYKGRFTQLVNFCNSEYAGWKFYVAQLAKPGSGSGRATWQVPLSLISLTSGLGGGASARPRACMVFK